MIQIHEFREKVAQLSDDLVDMESNLTPTVLRKNLFCLGLDLDWVEGYAGNIDSLMNRRNRIAHGEDKDGIAVEAYNKLHNAAFGVMNRIMELITQAVAKQHFRVMAGAAGGASA